MRENYRNSIASINKFPQFTTMNVIDGQAGLIICASLILCNLTVDNILNIILCNLTVDNILNIIVLLILAGVSISALTGENGLLNKARDAKTVVDNSTTTENTTLTGYENEIDKYIGSSSQGEVIDKATSYVGYYADIDGDKEPDGVIYADLAVSVSGQWVNSDGAFSYEAITGTKDYYVSKTNYDGAFGTKDVLTATGSGVDRFYVMALEDFNTGTAYCWYDAAYDSGISDYSTVTSTSFGTGKTNTSTMIAKWNSSAYGTQDDSYGAYADMWGVIQDKVGEGWFVPSKGEWSAFGYNLGITSSNYTNKGLPHSCWSSSLRTAFGAWNANFYAGYIYRDNFTTCYSVSLSATF